MNYEESMRKIPTLVMNETYRNQVRKKITKIANENGCSLNDAWTAYLEVHGMGVIPVGNHTTSIEDEM